MGVGYPIRALGPRADPAFALLRPCAATVGVVICVSSAAVAAASAPSDAAFGRGLLQLLVVGLPIAAGLYAVRSPANRHFGSALLALGIVCSLTPPNEAPPTVQWLIGLLWLGMAFLLVRRWRAASPLQKRALGPVVVVGAIMGALQLAFAAARELAAPAQAVETLGSAWALSIAGLAAAFLLGLVRRRLLLAGALGRLGGALRDSADGVQVQAALATVLRDPPLKLLYDDGGRDGWRDATGRRVSWPPELDRGRAVTAVGGEDGVRAVALIHDAALRDDEELLAGVNSMVLSGWRHECLLADLSNAMAGLESSRRRIAEAADIERARIEHDLHDGAQQRLIALRIKLSIAETLMETDPAAGIAHVRALGPEVDETLEELRTLAGGVYPPILTDRGIEVALRALARRMPLAMHVTAVGVTRHPSQVESAVYFVCVEALQNAMKHAASATGVWLRLTERSGTLRFEVRDDGPGFTPNGGPQRGVRNMRDRIEAIGGQLTIEARPGHGTRVIGSVDAA